MGRRAGWRALGAARRCALDGGLGSAGNLRVRRAPARRAQDRVHLRPRIHRARPPRSQPESGVRRRLYRERKITYETAERAVESGEADAVAFGKLFIANPDLPARFALRAPLNEPRLPEFYAGGARGYTDYPSLPRAAQSPDLNSSQARVNARVSSGV